MAITESDIQFMKDLRDIRADLFPLVDREIIELIDGMLYCGKPIRDYSRTELMLILVLNELRWKAANGPT